MRRTPTADSTPTAVTLCLIGGEVGGEGLRVQGQKGWGLGFRARLISAPEICCNQTKVRTTAWIPCISLHYNPTC